MREDKEKKTYHCVFCLWRYRKQYELYDKSMSLRKELEIFWTIILPKN